MNQIHQLIAEIFKDEFLAEAPGVRVTSRVDPSDEIVISFEHGDAPPCCVRIGPTMVGLCATLDPGDSQRWADRKEALRYLLDHHAHTAVWDFKDFLEEYGHAHRRD